MQPLSRHVRYGTVVRVTKCFHSNMPSFKSFNDIWTTAKPKLESTQHELHENANEFLNKMKGSVLEMMARRMPEDTKVFLAQRWGFIADKQTDPLLSAQQSKTESNSTTTASMTVPPPTPPEIPLKVHQELQSPESGCTVNEAAPDPVSMIEPHPILGKLVCDLKYKQVYVTSVRGLVQAPVWKKQRILRPDRSEKIAKAKITEGGAEAGLPGVITLYRDVENGRIGIVDGQHRAGALMLMSQSGHWNEEDLNILIDVYPTVDEKRVSALFTEINSSEPVKQIDMPTEGADERVRKILTEGTDALVVRYGDMFKPTSRCRPPHVHADTLRDELFQADFISRHNIQSTEDMLKKLQSINDGLSKKKQKFWNPSDSKRSKSLENALEKAKRYGFYLGMTKSWMNE